MVEPPPLTLSKITVDVTYLYTNACAGIWVIYFIDYLWLHFCIHRNNNTQPKVIDFITGFYLSLSASNIPYFISSFLWFLLLSLSFFCSFAVCQALSRYPQWSHGGELLPVMTSGRHVRSRAPLSWRHGWPTNTTLVRQWLAAARHSGFCFVYVGVGLLSLLQDSPQKVSSMVIAACGVRRMGGGGSL